MNETQQHEGKNGNDMAIAAVDFQVLREQRRWTNKHIGEQIGYSTAAVANVRQHASLPLLVALSDLFDVDIEATWASYRPGAQLPTWNEIDKARQNAKGRSKGKATAKALAPEKKAKVTKKRGRPKKALEEVVAVQQAVAAVVAETDADEVGEAVKRLFWAFTGGMSLEERLKFVIDLHAEHAG